MDVDIKPAIRRREPETRPRRGLADYFWLILTSPITLNLKLLSHVFRRLVRPFSPQLIPLAAVSFLFPILVFLSFFAGFYVWKHVAVGWETTIFLQYGDGAMPYAETPLPRLVAQQPYDISLQLLVPASESNFALGNFMTSLTLSSPSNKTLTSVRRPGLVTPGSPWSLTSILRTPTTVRINIPLLQAYVAGTSKLSAKVSLGRKDSWLSLGTGQGRELSVISATINGAIHHESIRGLVTRFPLVFGFLASATFFSISVMTVGMIMFPAIEWRLYRGEGEDGSPKNVGKRRRRSSHSRSDDEKPTRRPKSSSQNRSRSNRSSRTRSTHDPDTPVTILKSEDQYVPLRRRKSRLDTHSESE